MTPILQQLYGMRLMLDGLIATVEHELGLAASEDAGSASEGGELDGCPHPKELQVSASVMGGEPKVMCLACGKERPGTVPE